MSPQDQNQMRQSRVTREGAEFESHVRTFLNTYFESNQQRIRILDGREVFNDDRLKRMFSIPVRGFKTKWGDVDLVAKSLDTNLPLALISCKLSLHGRFSETLFYSLVYKQLIPDLKVVFVTPDKGRQDNPTEWRSEWGSHQAPTKDRALAERYLDGVYIDNVYLRDRFGFQGATNLGGKIKPFSRLATDIETWTNE